jgi:hypothetical protein
MTILSSLGATLRCCLTIHKRDVCRTSTPQPASRITGDMKRAVWRWDFVCEWRRMMGMGKGVRAEYAVVIPTSNSTVPSASSLVILYLF